MAVKSEYTYNLRQVMDLVNRQNTILAISEMSGGKIPPEEKQFYINTIYRLGENDRKGENDAGIRRTGGFSIQIQDIPRLCNILTELHKKTKDGREMYIFVCAKCTKNNDRITFHKKQSAMGREICPQNNELHSSAYIID